MNDSALRRPRSPVRARLATWFFVAFLAFQVIVPTLRLALPRPARFGWQMYSGLRFAPNVWLVHTDQHVEAIDPIKYVAHFRTEIHLDEYVPSFLCQHLPDVQAVRIQVADGQPVQEVVCR